jgi:hypothetical protein
MPPARVRDPAWATRRLRADSSACRFVQSDRHTSPSVSCEHLIASWRGLLRCRAGLRGGGEAPVTEMTRRVRRAGEQKSEKRGSSAFRGIPPSIVIGTLIAAAVCDQVAILCGTLRMASDAAKGRRDRERLTKRNRPVHFLFLGSSQHDEPLRYSQARGIRSPARVARRPSITRSPALAQAYI